MRILELELENIRSHTHTRITLPSGRIVLTGDIGSGKSSLLYAIEFALFGLLRGEQPSLLRQDAKQGSVRLTFTLHEKKITITRRLKRARQGVQQDTRVEWEENGEKLILTPSEARARIISLFNYPQEYLKSNPLLYRYTIFTPQEQLKSILLTNREDRVNLFRKLFNLEKYQRARENTSLILHKTSPPAESLEDAYEAYTQTRERLRALTDQISLAEEDVKEKEARLKNARKTMEDARTAYTEAQRILEKHRVLSEALKRARDELARIPEQEEVSIKSIEEELERVKREEERLAREEETAQQRLTTLREEKARVEAQRTMLEQRLANTPKPVARDARNRAAHLREAWENTHRLVQSIREEKENIMKEHARLEERLTKYPENISMLTHCPLCGQPLSQEHKERLEKEYNEVRERIAQLTQELQRLSEREEKAQRMLTHLQKEREEAERDAAREEAQEKEWEAWEKEKEALQNTLSSLATRLHELEEHIKVQEERLHELHAQKYDYAKRREALETRLRMAHEARLNAERRARLTMEIERLHHELQELPRVDEQALRERLQSAEEAVRKAEEAYRQARLRYEKLSLEADHARQLVEEKKIFLTRILQREAEARAAEKLNAWLTQQFTRILREVEENLFTRILTEFSARFTFWLRFLLPHATAQIEPDFTPLIYLDTREPLAYASLSGGERSSVALAYRLALYDTLRMMHHAIAGLLILDEPTEGFSSAQVEALIHAFNHVHADQLIIVTHEALLAEAAETRIHVHKEGNTSFVTIRE